MRQTTDSITNSIASTTANVAVTTAGITTKGGNEKGEGGGELTIESNQALITPRKRPLIFPN